METLKVLKQCFPLAYCTCSSENEVGLFLLVSGNKATSHFLDQSIARSVRILPLIEKNNMILQVTARIIDRISLLLRSWNENQQSYFHNGKS